MIGQNVPHFEWASSSSISIFRLQACCLCLLTSGGNLVELTFVVAFVEFSSEIWENGDEAFAMADDNVDKLYQIYDVLSTAGDKIKEVYMSCCNLLRVHLQYVVFVGIFHFSPKLCIMHNL
jgi:hypothetical protein